MRISLSPLAVVLVAIFPSGTVLADPVLAAPCAAGAAVTSYATPPISCRDVFNTHLAAAAPMPGNISFLSGCYEIHPPEEAAPIQAHCEFESVLFVLVENENDVTVEQFLTAPMVTKLEDAVTFFDAASYDRVTFVPHVFGDGGTGEFITDQGGTCELAKMPVFAQAASTNGIDFTEYERIVTMCTNYNTGNKPGLSSKSTKNVPSPGGVVAHPAFYQRVQQHLNMGLTRHELGHSLTTTAGFALGHATAKSSFDGARLDYGDHADTMGDNDGHLSAAFKQALGWLDVDNYTSLTNPTFDTTLEVHNLEEPLDNHKAVTVPLDGTLSLWVEVRRDMDIWDTGRGLNLTHGALIRTLEETGQPSTVLFDATPETPDDAPIDGALLPGRTYRYTPSSGDDIFITHLDDAGEDDPSAQIHIYRGAPSASAPAVASVTASACAGRYVELSASLVAPTGEEEFFWNFEVGERNYYQHVAGEPNYGYGASVSHTFTTHAGAPPWKVWLHVTDRRGGELLYPFTVDNACTVTTGSNVAPAATDIEWFRTGAFTYRLEAIVDQGGDDDPLYYAWQATSGTLNNPALPTPQVLFAGPGFEDLEVEVTDGELASSLQATKEVAREWECFASAAPGALVDHAMAYDELNRQVVLYGGSNGVDVSDETWVFDGVAWALIDTSGCAESPPALYRHAMAWDPAGAQVVMFGGRDSSDALLAETWTWDGGCWASGTTPAGLSARAQHGMATDYRRDGVVLYGGRDGPAYDDTWFFSAGTWTLQSPSLANHPGPRASHVMAWHKTLEEVVLFGGRTVLSKDDTWAFNGIDWREITPAAGAANPSARRGASAAWDERLELLVLYGGNPDDDSSPLGDTWELDGNAYVDMTASTSPAPAVRAASMAYHRDTGALVLHGGFLDATQISDQTCVSVQ